VIPFNRPHDRLFGLRAGEGLLAADAAAVDPAGGAVERLAEILYFDHGGLLVVGLLIAQAIIGRAVIAVAGHVTGRRRLAGLRLIPRQTSPATATASSRALRRLPAR
jgi:hypothetical protein